MADTTDTDEAEAIAPAPALLDINWGKGALAPLVTSAARGNLTAMRALYQDGLASLMYEPKPTADPRRAPLIMILEMMVYARLAASYGKPDDARDLAGALGMAANRMRELNEPALADAWADEAHSLLEQLAARGDDTAARIAEEVVPTGAGIIAEPFMPSQEVH